VPAVRRGKFDHERGEEATMVLQDGTDDFPAASASAPRNVAGRKVQTLQELTDDNARMMMGAAAAAAAGVQARYLSC